MKLWKPVALSLAIGAAGAAVVAAQPSIDLLRAVERAERAKPGQVVDVELDRDGRGKLVYEVDIAHDGALHEVRVDAASGALLGSSRRTVEGWLSRINGNSVAGLASARPLSASIRDLEATTGGKVTGVEYEMEAGRPRYEVEISTSAGIAELYIDPRTGQRLGFAVDD